MNKETFCNICLTITLLLSNKHIFRLGKHGIVKKKCTTCSGNILLVSVLYAYVDIINAMEEKMYILYISFVEVYYLVNTDTILNHSLLLIYKSLHNDSR